MSGSVRYPAIRVTANGLPVSGIVSAHWRLANAHNAARWSIVKAFSPADPLPPQFWTATTLQQIRVVISASLDGKSFTPIITGDVDSHAWQPIDGTISLEGRDLAALMIDSRTVTSYQNKTASEIAQAIAAEHGLSAVVTPTKTLAGRYYAQQHDRLSGGDFTRAVNEWDLLCMLGTKEGIDPYVSGTTLYFEKAPATPPAFTVQVSDTQGGIAANVLHLELERNLTQARDVDVTVKSWNGYEKRAVVGHAISKAVKDSASAGVKPTKYLFTAPNLTQAQADAEAKRLAIDISKHERRVSLAMPGAVDLTPQHVVQVTGTSTDCDLTYYPDEITTTFDLHGGLMTRISGRFTSPRNVVDGTSGATLQSIE